MMPVFGRRMAFAALYLAGQLALILTAGDRSDNAFGFRMFHESSTLNVRLVRYIEAPSGHGTVAVPVEGTTWLAHDAAGVLHRFDWRDRVRESALSYFGATFHASYGANAQLARFQAALDDVASHTPYDAETRQLGLEIDVRKNGRDPVHVSLTSRPRMAEGP
ncbi:hypothetical protein LZC95_42055 [Pendulispora brunnea]|uniref:Uncharacterized protein n=1 Tax=Pendulispora brunnea TaxID=2905690 RepID=A0ABZ2K847_9BACT